jgi:hypothetical protein
MKKIDLLFITFVIFGLLSCSKTDIEELPNELNNLNPDGTSKLSDTMGVHRFLGEKYLVLSTREQKLLYYALENEILSYKAIAIPEEDNINILKLPDSITGAIKDCDQGNFFYGYPSVIESGGKLMVVGERRESEKFVNSKSDNIMLIENEDRTWELTDFFKYAPYGNEFLGSIPMSGKTLDGKIVLKGKGLLVSEGDLGKWSHYPHAFDSVLNKSYVDHSPVFTTSSVFGMFFGTGQYIDKITKKYAAILSVDPLNGAVKEVVENWAPQLRKWTGTYYDIPEFHNPVFYSVEHNDLNGNKGDIVAFAINKDKVFQFVYNYKQGDTFDSISFTYSLTNITGSFSRHSPVGVEYNPVTERFEIIHSSPYYLEIYSMAPNDLLTSKLNSYGLSEWKKEAVILNREVTVRGQGMYPVSSIIDEKEGVQKIYIFAGDEYPSRAGIFEVKRTLETGILSSFIESRRLLLSSSHQ